MCALWVCILLMLLFQQVKSILCQKRRLSSLELTEMKSRVFVWTNLAGFFFRGPTTVGEPPTDLSIS